MFPCTMCIAPYVVCRLGLILGCRSWLKIVTEKLIIMGIGTARKRNPNVRATIDLTTIQLVYYICGYTKLNTEKPTM